MTDGSVIQHSGEQSGTYVPYIVVNVLNFGGFFRGKIVTLQAFACRRELVNKGLNDIPGLRCNKPGGAFYVFPNITETGLDSRAHADHLLHEADVAVLPGTSFGGYGEGYIRISFADSESHLAEAVRRIKAANLKLPAVAAEVASAK